MSKSSSSSKRRGIRIRGGGGVRGGIRGGGARGGGVRGEG